MNSTVVVVLVVSKTCPKETRARTALLLLKHRTILPDQLQELQSVFCGVQVQVVLLVLRKSLSVLERSLGFDICLLHASLEPDLDPWPAPGGDDRRP